MTYLTVDSKEDLIEKILSIDDSLLFQTRRKLIMTMRSIDFIEDERHDKDGFCWIKFKGSIGDQIILLHFSHNLRDSTDKSFYLSYKSFYKKMWGAILPHRDNDLPANLRYGTGDSIKSTRSFQYHYCGELKRTDLKNPIIVNIDENITNQYYYIPESTSNHDVYLYSIQMVDDKIETAIFDAGKIKISLETLQSIFPTIEKFTLQELIDINDHLSVEEKNLIQMVNI
jgi:hypothetical protein